MSRCSRRWTRRARATASPWSPPADGRSLSPWLDRVYSGEIRRKPAPPWPTGLLLIALLLVAGAIPLASRANVGAAAPLDRDRDTLPDALERRAGLDPDTRDLLSYVGGAGCSDRRSAAEVRSPGRPWCGVQRAVAAAPDGATVLVRAGVYDRFTASRVAARTVRLRAYPGEQVVLRGASISGSRLRLERFRITGSVNLLSTARRVALIANRWVTDGSFGSTNLDIQAGAQQLLIARNRIAQRASVRGANAINFSSTDTRPPISGVTIRDNRIGPIAGGGDAIQAKNTRSLLVEGNEIFEVRRPPGSGAHTDAFQSIYGAENLTLRRNFIHDIAAQGVFLQGFRGVNQGFRAEDNVVVRVASPWTAFAFDAVDARVIHNTIGGRFRVFQGTRGAAVVANIADVFVYSSGLQATRDEYNLARRFTRGPGRRSILGSPRYRNARRNDFRLKRGSPGRRKAPGGRDIGSRRANWSKRR